VVNLGARPDAIAWCSPLAAFLVAAGGNIWAVRPDGRARRVARLTDRARAIASSQEGLVAVATPSAHRGVSVYVARAGRLRLAGGGVEAWRRPERVAWGDLDGDGRIEALVLVTGRARFDRRLALRPFVYGWDGARLFPKWLGSRLSRPFDDATLGDLDGDGRADLVAVEHTREGTREIAAYRWRGFGFERIATSESLERVCGLVVAAGGEIQARTDGAVASYRLADDRIVRATAADR
jgi:hypothetical protein